MREGPVPAEVFREFPEQIAEEADRKILLVVDNCSIHHARVIRECLEANQAAVELYFQPAYSPQVNPVELLRALVQRRVSRQLSKTEAQLRDNLEAACQSLLGAPEQVRAFLPEADCKSILACILRTRLLTRSGLAGSRLMRNGSLTADYVRRAIAQLRAVDVLHEDGSWADVIRESQEIVELARKGLLRAVGANPPCVPDVAEVLESARSR